MNTQPQTSFVPRKNLVQNRPLPISMGLVTLIGFVVLGTALVVFASVFGYRWFLIQSINRPCDASGDQGCGLVESLERERRDLDIDKVTRLANLDAKMKAAQGIVNGHISLIPLLALLEENTLHTIRFTGLEFSQSGSIKLKGIAKQYEDIAVQMRVLRDTGKVIAASFSNFSVKDSDIAFDLELAINQELLKYQANTN